MIYAFVHLKVTDHDAMLTYREKAGDALAKHGGGFVTVVPEPTKLEGPVNEPDMAGILSFPDRESAMNWFEDSELAELHDKRRSIGESSIILLA